MKDQDPPVRPAPLDEAGRTRRFVKKTVVSSRELFFGAKEVWIEHGNELYCLRLTKQRKLILTK